MGRLIAPVIVLLAVLAMIALGFWQWERRAEKAALIARFEANQQVGDVVPVSDGADVADTLLFRQALVRCDRHDGWRPIAGRDVDGRSGYRFITSCRASDSAGSVLVDFGIAQDPATRPSYAGGDVRGIIVPGPDQPSLVDRMLGRTRAAPVMVQASEPAGGLTRTQQPSPRSVPNNHLAYAVQWWLFALAALVIYVLAARRR